MIKRVERRDAKKVAEFLQRTFEEDAAAHGDPAIQHKDAVEARTETATMWCCIENGKVVGALQSFKGGVIEVWEEIRTFEYYNLLAVDYGLYTASQSDAVRISRELCQASVNEMKAKPPDFIVVEGPTDSRGASWCRNYLRMSETVRGSESWFIQPFDTTCKRLKELE